MINKSDWQAVYERLTAEDRRMLGDPPTVEELEAYSRGELTPEEDERIRALLVAYPELAHAVAAEFPEDDALPGDEGYVSDAEVARRLAAFHREVNPQRSVHRQAGSVLFFRYAPTAVAAALALVFAGLYWQAQTTARRLSTDVAKPRAVSVEQLRSENVRGPGGALELRPSSGGSLMQVPIGGGETYFSNYRIDIADAATNEVRWTLTEQAPVDGNTFPIFVPREILTQGSRFRIVVYGLAGESAQRLDSYLVQVPRASGR